MKNAPLPQRIVCYVTCEKASVPGILVLIVMKTRSKNSNSFVVGPSGEDGIVTLEKSEIQGQAEAQLELALMDYHPIKEVFSGEVVAEVMVEVRIKKALSTYREYGELIDYPLGYRNMLESALEVIREMDVSKIDIAAKTVD